MSFHVLLRETKAILCDSEARPSVAVISANLLGACIIFACVSTTKSQVLTGYAFMVVVDLFLVATSLCSLWVRRQKPTATFTFGYEKFEVLAVFSSTVLAQLGALFIVKESVERLLEQPEVHTGRLNLGAVIGLLCHISVIYLVPNEPFKHVVVASASSWIQEHVADMSQSLCSIVPGLSSLLLPRINPFMLLAVFGFFACFLTSLLLEFQQCSTCDSVTAIIFAVMIIGTMYPMTVFSGKILLQTSPSHVLAQLDKCLREASTLDGVLEFTNEHFWQTSFGKLAGSVHVRVRRDADEQLVLAHVTDKLSSVVSSLTVQIVKDADWHTLGVGSGDKTGGIANPFSPAANFMHPPTLPSTHDHNHGHAHEYDHGAGHGHSHDNGHHHSH